VRLSPLGILLFGLLAGPAFATHAPGQPPNVFVYFDSPDSGATINGTVNFSGRAYSLRGETVTITLDLGGPPVTAELVREGFEEFRWTATLDTTPRHNGRSCVSARIVSSSGDHNANCRPVVLANPAWRDLRALDVNGTGGVPGRTDGPIGWIAWESTNDAELGFTSLLEIQRGEEWRTLTTLTHEPGRSSGEWTWHFNGPIVGCFPLRLTLDPENVIIETNEANNVAVGQICLNALPISSVQFAPFDP